MSIYLPDKNIKCGEIQIFNSDFFFIKNIKIELDKR